MTTDASEPASERVRRTWVQRAAAEYTSAALTQQLGHWLTLVGAPVELVLASLDIVRDELDHAGLCHDVAAQAGATAGPVLAQDRMQHARGPEGALAADLLRALIRSFCVGETLAVPLFRAMREGCSVPAARAVLDRILVDEVRHREFAWIALEWLLAAPASAGLAPVAAASAAEAVAGRISRCSEPLEQVLADLPTAAERAWGLIGQARYRELVLEAIERELRPRFARLGVALPASF